jgi:hypothetical protein
VTTTASVWRSLSDQVWGRVPEPEIVECPCCADGWIRVEVGPKFKSYGHRDPWCAGFQTAIDQLGPPDRVRAGLEIMPDDRRKTT